MGQLTRIISPRVLNFSVTPLNGQVSLQWDDPLDTLGAVTQTVTRTPAFASPVTVTTSAYTDFAVAAGQNYTYQVTATDERGLDSYTAPVTVTVPNQGGSTVFADDFEGVALGSFDSTKWSTSVDAVAGDYSQGVVNTFAAQGTKSMYRSLTWDPAHTFQDNGVATHSFRVEHASKWNAALLDDCWYGITFKPDTLPQDALEVIIFQMHDVPVAGEIITNVPFAFEVDNDLYRFWIIHCEDLFGASSAPNRKTTNYGPAGSLPAAIQTDDNGTIDPAFWTVDHTNGNRFVVHIKWDHRGETFPTPAAGNTGLVEIWKKPIGGAYVKYVKKSGPVGYDHPQRIGPNLKTGFYKSLQRTIDPGVGKRFISAWWDDIKVDVGANRFNSVA